MFIRPCYAPGREQGPIAHSGLIQQKVFDAKIQNAFSSCHVTMLSFTSMNFNERQLHLKLLRIYAKIPDYRDRQRGVIL